MSCNCFDTMCDNHQQWIRIKAQTAAAEMCGGKIKQLLYVGDVHWQAR